MVTLICAGSLCKSVPSFISATDDQLLRLGKTYAELDLGLAGDGANS